MSKILELLESLEREGEKVAAPDAGTTMSPLPAPSAGSSITGFVRSQSAAAFASPLCLRSASFALPIPHPVNEQRSASFFAISFLSKGEGSEVEAGTLGDRVDELGGGVDDKGMDKLGAGGKRFEVTVE